MIDLYLREPERPSVIDLSGGQPDLVPEWLPWTMRALRERGLEGRVYLWSDDNLSNDFFWRYLSEPDLDLVSSFRGYGRVGCFKGFDTSSFAFNTAAAPELFDRQFELLGRLIRFGLDVYGYVTLTRLTRDGILSGVCASLIASNRSRQTYRYASFHWKCGRSPPSVRGSTGSGAEVLSLQFEAVSVWRRELERRFSAADLGQHVVDVRLQA